MNVFTKVKVCQELKDLIEKLDTKWISTKNARDLSTLANILGYNTDAELIQLYYNESNYSNTLATARQVIEKYERSLKEGDNVRKLFID